MLQAPIPNDENKRLKAVMTLDILDSETEKSFDEITEAAINIFQVPMSTISILDKEREWYKSCAGMCNSREGDRGISFCGHALFSEQIFIIEDTLLDERFKDNPYVIGPPFIRFYAGMRLLNRKEKQPVGVFCIKDIKPRKFDYTMIAAFLTLAEKAEIELNKNSESKNLTLD